MDMITMVGSCNVDYLTYCNRLPVHGETHYGDDMFITAGGKGANQIAAVARLGAPTCFISKVGDDNNAVVITDCLQWAGVDISKVGIEEDTYCGAGFGTIGQNAQNFFTIIKGANEMITPSYVEKYEDHIANAELLMTEFMISLECSEYALSIAKGNAVPTIVNPSPAFSVSDTYYKMIDYITPNEVETFDMTGMEVIDDKSAAKAAEYYFDKGVKNVVITMGRKGAFASNGVESQFIQSYKVEAKDTTGAGDSFNGGFAYALWSGKDIFEAARFANAVASISVMRKGTMASMPTLIEVEEVLKMKR
jgi:ribokinase